MRRAFLILILGLASAAAAYAVVYLDTTAKERMAMKGDAPELLWLKQEFHLDETQFKRICELHEGYLPECGKTCQKIAAKNVELRAIFAKTATVTPAMEEVLKDIAKLRAECQANMLRHFYEVSRAMPPEQGRRYLAWVQEKTILTGPGQMDMSSGRHPMQ